MKLRFFAILVLTFFIQLGYAQNDTTYDEMLQSHYRGTVPLMQPEDLYKRMLNDETIHLLDTRESREYKVSALKGAAHVGFLFFSSSKVETVDKDDLVVVYCTIGARSETVGEKLLKNGFSNVYNLYGGIIYWKNQGYPVYHNGKKTDDVHVYSKKWGEWLHDGKPRY